jgi:hypothetical protein
VQFAKPVELPDDAGAREGPIEQAH